MPLPDCFTKIWITPAPDLSNLFIYLFLVTSLVFVQCGVRLMRGVVKELHQKKIVLSDGTDVPYGLLIWSTGVGSSQFVQSLALPKSPGGR